MRRLFVVCSMLALISCSFEECFACDCATPSPEESFRIADMVFIGEVVGKQEGSLLTTFRVQKTLKGMNAVDVSIAGGKSNCDFPFVVGLVYLVYARNSNGTLVSAACSGTFAIGVASKPPPAPSSFPARVLVIAGGAIFLGLVWMLHKRLRARGAE